MRPSTIRFCIFLIGVTLTVMIVDPIFATGLALMVWGAKQ